MLKPTVAKVAKAFTAELEKIKAVESKKVAVAAGKIDSLVTQIGNIQEKSDASLTEMNAADVAIKNINKLFTGEV